MESVVSSIKRVFFNQLDQGVIDRIQAVQAAVSVASSESDQATKDIADFVCNGTDDQVTINQAVDSLANGGRVLLTEGNFFITGTIKLGNMQSIEGQSESTVLTIPDSTNTIFNVIENDDLINGNSQMVISNLAIDGNRANNTADNVGVFFQNVTNSTINRVFIENMTDEGAKLDSSTDNIITFSFINNSGHEGMLLQNLSSNNIIAFNTVNNSVADGIEVNTGENCLIFMNKTTGNVHGVRVHSPNNLMVSNLCDNNTGNGILINGGTNSLIVGCSSINNDVRGYSVAGASRSVISNNFGANNTRWGLTLFDSDDCLISDNFLEGNGDDGINLTSDSNSNFVTNNRVLNNGINGILIDSSTEDGNVVIHNMLRNAEGTGSALQDNGTNTTTILSGNILT